MIMLLLQHRSLSFHNFTPLRLTLSETIMEVKNIEKTYASGLVHGATCDNYLEKGKYLPFKWELGCVIVPVISSAIVIVIIIM